MILIRHPEVTLGQFACGYFLCVLFFTYLKLKEPGGLTWTAFIFAASLLSFLWVVILPLAAFFVVVEVLNWFGSPPK